MAFDNIAIIGAGLCGLTLSVPLQRSGIKTVIYESRPKNASNTPGAIMLSPNGLQSLDALGVCDSFANQGYRFQEGIFRSNEHEFIDSYEMGNAERYGYDALRIYRQVLLDSLRAKAIEAGVEIRYEKKFSHVTSEDDDGISFACADGQVQRFDMIIGADGIHSSVRPYLFSDVKITFSGIMSIITADPTSAIRFPFAPYELPTSLHGETGAFILAPQGIHGQELLLATQQATHDRDRKGWDALQNDKRYLVDLVKRGYDRWNTTVQDALDAVDPAKIFAWPFYSVPKLPSWTSAHGKLVVLGDAAHAIPPAAGQGVNQGFEDVHSLALLITAARKGKADWDQSLRWWQQYRQERIDCAAEVTEEMSRRRQPGWVGRGTSTIDNSALYGVQVDEDVKQWLANEV